MSGTLPHYPFLSPTTLAIAVSALTGGRRDFLADARRLVRGLEPPVVVEGGLPDLTGSGWLIVANHYRTPTFRAWWISIALTAILGTPIHWVMTSAWTYPDTLGGRVSSVVMCWVLARIAATYGFSTMPAMPPRPEEVKARAQAVRAVLHYAATTPRPCIGLVPEGGDSPDATLMSPPPGAGRFVALLLRFGLRVLPVGVFEAGGCLHTRLGEPLKAPPLPLGPADARDRRMSEWVMRGIAACLPPELRGAYA